MYHRKMIRKRNAFNYLRNAAEYLQSTDGLKDCEIPWDLLQINGLLRRITELAQLGNNLMAVPSMTNCVKITGYNQN